MTMLHKRASALPAGSLFKGNGTENLTRGRRAALVGSCVLLAAQLITAGPAAADKDGVVFYGTGTNNASAIGTNGFAISHSAANAASASGTYSIALGNRSKASSYGGAAVGYNSTASGANGASAYGWLSTASGNRSSAYGINSKASGFDSSAIGSNSTANGNSSSAFGYRSTASGTNSLALGQSSNAGGASNNAGGTAIGSGAQAGAGAAGQTNATAVGIGATANAANSLAFGRDATAGGAGSAAVGAHSAASGNFSLALGPGAVASNPRSVALGNGSVADQNNTVSVGSVGGERRVVNVAAAVDPTDAVNLAQLQAMLSGAGTSASLVTITALSPARLSDRRGGIPAEKPPGLQAKSSGPNNHAPVANPVAPNSGTDASLADAASRARTSDRLASAAAIENSEGLEPSTIIGWANVNVDGTVSSSRNIAGNTRHGIGDYEIVFRKKSLLKCTYNATLGSNGLISVRPGTLANSLKVEVRSHNGVSTDSPFYLMAVC